ncbi:uncharacterized protein LOC120339541 [Styela clava]
MPVYGLLKDHQMGTFLLRPSSVHVGRSLGNCGFRSTNFQAFQSSKNIRSRPASANIDRNVVIAAYGTQVTLHRSLDKKTETYHKTRKTSATTKPRRERGSPIDIRVPTANISVSGYKATPPTDDKVSSTTRPPGREIILIEDEAKFSAVSDVETGEFNVAIDTSKERVYQSKVSDSSAENDIFAAHKPVILASGNMNAWNEPFASPPGNNGANEKDKTLRWKQTAWNKRRASEHSQITPSAVKFVDIAEVANSFPDLDNLKMSQNRISVDVLGKPTSVKIPSGSPFEKTSPSENFVPNNSPDSIDLDAMSNENVRQYFVNKEKPTLTGSNSDLSYLARYRDNQGSCTAKIREVWSTRNTKEVSSRMYFTHETLQRPRSASTSRYLDKSIQYDTSMPTKQASGTQKTKAHEKAAGRIGTRKRCALRRKKKIGHALLSRSLNSLDFYQQQQQNRDLARTSTLNIEAVYVDCKSLIRQNHRPTTAIQYCKQDQATLHSITPCVRKAKVAHTTYIAMHHHEPTSPRIDNRHKQYSELHAPAAPNLKVKAKSLSRIKHPSPNRVSEVRQQETIKSSLNIDPNNNGFSSQKINRDDNSLKQREISSDSGQTSASQPYKRNKKYVNIKTVRDEITAQNDRISLLLLLQQQAHDDSDENEDESSVSKDLIEEQRKSSLSQNVSPLSRPHVETLEDATEVVPGESECATKKNRLIQQWLQNVEMSQKDLKNPHNQSENL